MNRPETLGALKDTGYQSRSIKTELRENLLLCLAEKTPLFPGVHGYDRTVIPGLVNAILAGHDLILLGLRGQAKTKLLRGLTDLLDEQIPALVGCELNDDPLAPISVTGQKLIADLGDQTPIRCIDRSERYNEKLATPDVSIADLLGDVDPIKAANQNLTFSDPEVIHWGIVPRTNRGIFAINELPDLSPRIQVGLLNILEERDLQIRGFPIRVPLDIQMVFSANPEDYTNRGSIITPLKDRIASQILTHYPADLETAARITTQEAWTERGVEAPAVQVGDRARLLIEEISLAARESDLVDQSSGVSARVAIAALELLVSNLERRAVTTGEDRVAARLCDFHMIMPAVTGKIEIVYEGEQKGIEMVVKQIIGRAVRSMFVRDFPAIGKEVGSGGEGDDGPYAAIVAWFADGNSVTLSDDTPNATHHQTLAEVPGLFDLVSDHTQPGSDQESNFLAEMVLEALHQHVKLAREDLDSQISYKELVKFQLLRGR